ncbi:hypothetical protein C1O63_1482 [Dehalococcoides mccartyi]|uniref:hypothetical protein n=1 Tax=Dehalococcoides mccartyi TaxID=61435 RepID=UPI000D44B5DE|nr:hypothetical protein [Dehalococcoides mccartyi]POZ58435.1 hypothetical protein C1O63_1482 [Dehalococcoides mccartyi]
MRIIISLTSLFLILLVSVSCSATTPEPVYTPQTEDVTATLSKLTPAENSPSDNKWLLPTPTSNSNFSSAESPSPSKSVQAANLYWSKLVDIATPLISDVLQLSSINHSDEESMTLFRDKLISKGVAAGLVKITSRLGANGNLNYCVAVNTLDKGIVFLYVLPKGLEISNEDNRLQEVYLKNGERVGLLSAIYATSSDYSWYVNYLEETYADWDYGDYITEFGNIVDKNKTELDRLCSKIEDLIDFAESPNISIYDSAMSQAQIDAKYNSLLNEVDIRINQYNNYKDQYNAQVEEYNVKLNSYLIESENYPYELFYVEEYTINPNRISYPLITIPSPIPFPVIPIKPYSLYTIDTYLDALQNRVSQDYSYNMLPEPDKSQFKAERITDKNFIVDDFKIKW